MGYGTFKKKKMKTCRNGNKLNRRLIQQLYNNAKSWKKTNREDKKIKFIIFGDSVTKLVVPEKNKINCDEYASSNFSQNGAKVKDIYNQIEYLKKNIKFRK